MATPNATGKQFEERCIDLLNQHRDYVNTKCRWFWSGTNCYKPDAVTSGELYEFKYQQVSGSARNKLTQALFELQLMSVETGLTAFLIYEGNELISFVEQDPAFQLAKQSCPNVHIHDFNSFNAFLNTTSTNCDNRDTNRLLEYAA